MTDKKHQPIRVSDRALEMVMRDVLDGMMELSLETAYQRNGLEFEILPMEWPEFGKAKMEAEGGESHRDTADIIDFPQLRRAAG
ncbi:MAG: hypothetical protein GY703_03830 [Gammaproteobacteria bacterium]|nr:hypothetical protein [Gammaproteobacteria bacterium]